MKTKQGKGKFKVGYVKRTQGQKKKHISQMTSQEVDVIHEGIDNLSKLYASQHVIRKIKNDGLWFTSDMVVEVLTNFSAENIIEYNVSQFYGKLDRRVLLRSSESYPVLIDGKGKVDCNLCFVLSLDRGALVTVYWNEAGDNHSNIDMNRYDETLTVK